MGLTVVATAPFPAFHPLHMRHPPTPHFDHTLSLHLCHLLTPNQIPSTHFFCAILPRPPLKLTLTHFICASSARGMVRALALRVSWYSALSSACSQRCSLTQFLIQTVFRRKLNKIGRIAHKSSQTFEQKNTI